MRVLVVPDRFGDRLDAAAAAAAIAEGWSRRAPADDVVTAPVGDAGAGFAGVVQSALGGELVLATTDGPVPCPVSLLLADHDGRRTVWLDSAQLADDDVDPVARGTHDVGLALGAALDLARERGAGRVVVGCGTRPIGHDGGAGLLAGLGATADVDLTAGVRGLRGVTSVDLAPARATVGDIDLVLATDVGTGLLGMFGATRAGADPLGLDDAGVIEVDGLLDAWAGAVVGTSPAAKRAADAASAGAGGGVGFALQALGGTVTSGIGLVCELVGVRGLARSCDLVVTGESVFDHTSRSGSVVHAVASVAAEAVRPCIALAGEVLVGAREMRAMGVESAYAADELVGADVVATDPESALRDLAARVARTWSPGRGRTGPGDVR